MAHLARIKKERDCCVHCFPNNRLGGFSDGHLLQESVGSFLRIVLIDCTLNLDEQVLANLTILSGR